MYAKMIIAFALAISVTFSNFSKATELEFGNVYITKIDAETFATDNSFCGGGVYFVLADHWLIVDGGTFYHQGECVIVLNDNSKLIVQGKATLEFNRFIVATEDGGRDNVAFIIREGSQIVSTERAMLINLQGANNSASCSESALINASSEVNSAFTIGIFGTGAEVTVRGCRIASEFSGLGIFAETNGEISINNSVIESISDFVILGVVGSGDRSRFNFLRIFGSKLSAGQIVALASDGSSVMSLRNTYVSPSGVVHEFVDVQFCRSRRDLVNGVLTDICQ